LTSVRERRLLVALPFLLQPHHLVVFALVAAILLAAEEMIRNSMS